MENNIIILLSIWTMIDISGIEKQLSHDEFDSSINYLKKNNLIEDYPQYTGVGYLVTDAGIAYIKKLIAVVPEPSYEHPVDSNGQYLNQ